MAPNLSSFPGFDLTVNDRTGVAWLSPKGKADQYLIGDPSASISTTGFISSATRSGVVLIPLTEGWTADRDLDSALGATSSRLVAREDPEPIEPLVSYQLDRIEEILGLNDTQVGEAFPNDVRRETVNRWRHDPSPHLREGNLYRLGLLYQLALSIREAGMDGVTWLHQPSQGGGPTPFELICDGYLSEVQTAVTSVATGLSDPKAPMERLGVLHSLDEPAEVEDDGEWID
jgi:hypothetical protein